MIEIMITDDHPMVLEGLKNVLATEEDLNLAACFTDGASLVAGLKEKQPDILLLDINLPDINSIELVARLKSAHPDMKIIALSVHNEFAVINSMLSEGASGYIQEKCFRSRNHYRHSDSICRRAFSMCAIKADHG